MACTAQELLRTNVNRDAATLEEWVRYPVANNKGGSHVAKGNFGYKENWWSVLDDTTIFGVVGNPSWQADSYREAVQFAASWTPRLLLWNRELMQALEQRAGRRGQTEEKKELSDLRKLEQTVRRSVSDAHAEELCRLRSDRRYLEWMMEAVGTTSIQGDLERRIHTMRLLIDETEKKEQEQKGRQEEFLSWRHSSFWSPQCIHALRGARRRRPERILQKSLPLYAASWSRKLSSSSWWSRYLREWRCGKDADSLSRSADVSGRAAAGQLRLSAGTEIIPRMLSSNSSGVRVSGGSSTSSSMPRGASLPRTDRAFP